MIRGFQPCRLSRCLQPAWQLLPRAGFAAPAKTQRPIRAVKPPVNHYINATQMRVIDENGHQLGILPKRQAIQKAEQAGLDLVLMSGPNVDPPVCRILSYGRWKYEKEKAEKERKAKSKAPTVVEVALGTRISDHDLGWKTDKARQWLEKGNQIKFKIEPERRVARQAQAAAITQLLDKAVDLVKDCSKVLQRREDLKMPFPFALVAPLTEKDKKEREKAAAVAGAGGAASASKPAAPGNPAATTATATAATSTGTAGSAGS